MNSGFLKGIGSIDLFPAEKSIKRSNFTNLTNLKINFLTDEEAFKSDLKLVGQDMWNAIRIVEQSLNKKL